MVNVTRFGVSLEPELLNKFDRLIKRKGYASRSEAVRDMVRKALTEEGISTHQGKVHGTLTLIYDHDASHLSDRLTHVQHEYHHLISSTTHIHIDHHRCLEVLVVKGKAKDIKRMADAISSMKGVLQGELVLAAPKAL
jgi:CopG family nickel-responsive transcriptional regulator